MNVIVTIIIMNQIIEKQDKFVNLISMKNQKKNQN